MDAARSRGSVGKQWALGPREGRDVVGRRTEQAETPKPEEPGDKPEGE